MAKSWSQSITSRIQRQNIDIKQIAEAQRFAHQHREKPLEEGKDAAQALHLLAEVIDGIFGDLSQLQAHEEERLQQLIDLAESSADLSLMAGNSWVYLLETKTFLKALKEIPVERWGAALQLLRMDDRARYDELMAKLDDS